MAIRCLRHLLLLALWRPGAAQGTKASLGIGVGSRLDSVFDSADADQDGVLSQGEMAVFNQQGEALVGNFALVKPFEVTLFSEADCMGQNRTVDGSSNETRCSKCFDACGHDFEGGGAMAVMSSSSTTGVESKVRSLRVSSGAPQVVVDLCRGSYNYGVAGMEATSVRSSSAGCMNFPGSGPAHVAALPQEVAELVAMVFLKADTAPFDDRLTASEATVAGLAPLVQAADADKDGSLSTEEYATLLVHDVVRRSRKDASFMSAAAMEAAAETLAIAELAASGQDPAAATEQADAQLFFGAEYSEEKEDPAQGIPTTTPEPQRDANGNIILAGGPSGEDFGDVKDPSPVDGLYDPQTGEVMMCVNGKEFHAGLCYDYCNFDYTLAILSLCWKEECPSGWFEIAGGFCKRSGWNLDTKLMESYDRGLGELPSTCTLGDSFGPGRIVDDGIRDFTVIFVSDTQLPWCGDKPRGNMGCAMEENFRIVQGIHEVRELKWVVGEDFNASDEQVQEPLGVHITGDLTAFAHPYQFHAYRKIWETRPGEDPDKNLKLPMWPGLGNHDYANNLGDCLYIEEEPTWSGYWRASCAQRMIAYIRSAVGGCDGRTVVNNFGGAPRRARAKRSRAVRRTRLAKAAHLLPARRDTALLREHHGHRPQMSGQDKWTKEQWRQYGQYGGRGKGGYGGGYWRGAYAARSPKSERAVFPAYDHKKPGGYGRSEADEDVAPPLTYANMLQQRLNATRKAEQKVQNVEQSIVDRKKQWAEWEADMKKSFTTEYNRFQNELKRLDGVKRQALDVQEQARAELVAVAHGYQRQPQTDVGERRWEEALTSWRSEGPDMDSEALLKRALAAQRGPSDTMSGQACRPPDVPMEPATGRHPMDAKDWFGDGHMGGPHAPMGLMSYGAGPPPGLHPPPAHTEANLLRDPYMCSPSTSAGPTAFSPMQSPGSKARRDLAAQHRSSPYATRDKDEIALEARLEEKRAAAMKAAQVAAEQAALAVAETSTPAGIGAAMRPFGLPARPPENPTGQLLTGQKVSVFEEDDDDELTDPPEPYG
ncbi:unnamed protein product [Symbiodinium sp. CCMP2592]|nr:unnamed protein product [Symbiodinium sp. CCMP2592]